MTDQTPKPSAADPMLDQPDPQVAVILDKYLQDIQNGRACTRKELLQQHPDLKDALTEYLSSIDMVAGLGVGDDLLTQKVGDFEIVKPIGCGAMGVVYLANQISLKRQVALKVLRYTVVDKQATYRFEREAELVATLRHPNIVPIYTTGQQDGTHYLAMRLIGGQSLSQWSVEKNADRNPKRIAKWGVQAARALAHAHSQNVIHRDVKPSNLLLEQDHVWLSDFGLARRHDDLRMSMTGAMLGTPNYMSPEQAAPTRRPADHRSDIYSLGATLFELLTGRCVFVADTPLAVLAQVIAEEPPPLRSVLPDASRDLETILLRCLDKYPGDRYQTADELADDLQAYAEDRAIKARRPSLIERATRWKRKNQKVVSAAIVAASAAVMLLAVGVAGWMAWKDSVTGTVEFASGEGPIVGRLIDESGNASPTFTIPTEKPLPFAAGDHTLQTWAGGRMGESQKVTIAAGMNRELTTRLCEESVFEDRTVQGVHQVLPLGDRDDLLFFHKEGITRMDGRTGKELWTARSEKFIAAISKIAFKKLVAKRKAKSDKAGGTNASVSDMEAPVFWSIPEYQPQYDQEGDHNQQSFPVVTAGFPDINDDGRQDVMIASRRDAVLLAFDGKDGDLLWHYNAGILNEQSRTIHKPISLGDIDGDKVNDYGCLFFSFAMGNKPNPTRWLDAVSGKTGQRIWRRSLATTLFDVPPKMYQPSSCQIELMRGSGSHFQTVDQPGNGWMYRRGPYKQMGNGALAPTAGVMVPQSEDDAGEQLLLACGNKIISCDAATGEPGRFNRGQPLELDFVPAIQPRVVQTSSNGKPMRGLLLAEIVSTVAKPVPNAKTQPKSITRFSMRSMDNGEELWRYDANYDLEWWPGSQSHWPQIANLNGDSSPEILIADGTDLENSHPTGLASLQALDAGTGKPIWKAAERAKIRSLDRQIQYALIGPDEDGDGLADIYVVTPMAKSQCLIFVDILSGVTGERLRTVSSEVPVFRADHNGFSFEKPFFIDHASDGQGLVIASQSMVANYERHSTVVMSTETGELIYIGDQLEHPVLADGDGDGHADLFLLKPRDRSRPFKSSQLVTLKSGGGGIKFAGAAGQSSGGSKLTLIDDVDGDGVRDLLNAPMGHYLSRPSSQAEALRRVVSGANGKGLYEWEFRRHVESLYGAGGDFDNDGTNDFLAQWRPNGNDMVLFLVSGAKGKVLWQQPTTIIQVSDATTVGHDINGDGQLDLLLFHHFADDSSLPARFRLTCRDGGTGEAIWDFDIAPTNSVINGFHKPHYESRIKDINGDGHADVLLPGFQSARDPSTVAINGKTGKPIYTLPPLSKGSGRTPSGWQSEIIPSGQDNRFVFVSAWEGRNSKRKYQLNVDFFDLASGNRVSTWSADGRFAKPQVSYGERSQTEQIPLAIADGEKRFAGIMIKSGRQDELVVLDFSSDTAKEVRRISSGQLILVDDLDGDGKTEGVFFDEKEFVTIELASGKEVNRSAPAWASHIQRIRFESQTGSEPKMQFIRVETNQGQNRRLKLIDPATLQLQWDMSWPQDTEFAGLLCGGGSSETASSSAPRVLFRSGFSAIVATASANDFQGNDNAFAKQFRPAVSRSNDRKLTGASFKSVADDPRLVEPLPWNYYGNAMAMFEIEGLSHGPVELITQLFPIVLGGLVFPIWLVFSMIRRKQWSLQKLLLLPVAVALPYILFQLPSSLGAEYSAASTSPWLSKLFGAITLLPFLICIAVFVKYCMEGRWKRLGLLTVVSLSVPLAMAASEIATTNLIDSGRFDWLDPGSLSLLWAGVWVGGVVIAVFWLLAFLTKPVFRWFRRRRENSNSVEPVVA